MMRRISLLKLLLAPLCLAVTLMTSSAFATDLKNVSLDDGTDVEIRVFPADGDTLLLGFACDEGRSQNQEKTAAILAEDGVEVWMPDMLGAYMLPKVRSSLNEIPNEALVELVTMAAEKSGKDKVFLIAGGPDSELVLRIAAAWEQHHGKDALGEKLGGGILLFPRLMDGKPVPGAEPKYVEAVGKTKMPLMLLEGERTPNRWGMQHLQDSLQAGGSEVIAKVIPAVRGYFFSREDANAPESLVTSQLSGLIKASLFYLKDTEHEFH